MEQTTTDYEDLRKVDGVLYFALKRNFSSVFEIAHSTGGQIFDIKSIGPHRVCRLLVYLHKRGITPDWQNWFLNYEEYERMYVQAMKESLDGK